MNVLLLRCYREVCQSNRPRGDMVVSFLDYHVAWQPYAATIVFAPGYCRGQLTWLLPAAKLRPIANIALHEVGHTWGHPAELGPASRCKGPFRPCPT